MPRTRRHSAIRIRRRGFQSREKNGINLIEHDEYDRNASLCETTDSDRGIVTAITQCHVNCHQFEDGKKTLFA